MNSYVDQSSKVIELYSNTIGLSLPSHHRTRVGFKLLRCYSSHTHKTFLNNACCSCTVPKHYGSY